MQDVGASRLVAAQEGDRGGADQGRALVGYAILLDDPQNNSVGRVGMYQVLGPGGSRLPVDPPLLDLQWKQAVARVEGYYLAYPAADDSSKT